MCVRASVCLRVPVRGWEKGRITPLLLSLGKPAKSLDSEGSKLPLPKARERRTDRSSISQASRLSRDEEPPLDRPAMPMERR